MEQNLKILIHGLKWSDLVVSLVSHGVTFCNVVDVGHMTMSPIRNGILLLILVSSQIGNKHVTNDTLDYQNQGYTVSVSSPKYD